MQRSPCLLIFGGLPASGKSTLARAVAHTRGAAYLRIDSIEQAPRGASGWSGPLEDAGYRVAYAIAADQLRLGHPVVADSVSPFQVKRDRRAPRTHGQVAGMMVAVQDEVAMHPTGLDPACMGVPAH